MRYDYYFNYDAIKDEFSAWVYPSPHINNAVFEIATVKEIRQLLKDKHMSHIDDINGLEKYLKAQKILDYNDWIWLDKDSFL